MNVRSRIVMDARISPYRRREIPVAEDFVDAIPYHSVTLFDKGFRRADFLLRLQQEGVTSGV